MNRCPKQPRRQALPLETNWSPGSANDAWDELWRSLLSEVVAERRREETTPDTDADDYRAWDYKAEGPAL